MTAFYEPLNPRRWFDPQHRGTRVDATHQGVANYWSEYDQLRTLDVPWDDGWPHSNLYIPACCPEFKLQDYFRTLIQSCDGIAALQFNRIDFRLAWIRRSFPDAYLVHLFRNPRDQWLSTYQKHQPPELSARIGAPGLHDEFYLTAWARDLGQVIPLLADHKSFHPYELSYLIWRLSYNSGREFADYSLSYESILKDPNKAFGSLLKSLAIHDELPNQIVADIRATNTAKWKKYADETWFAAREQRCDELLQRYVHAEPRR